jgi:hypothetical protein
MFHYRLFGHDGGGNFNLVSEFSAINDAAAATIVEQSCVRPLELWQATRKVRLWS